MKKIFTAILGLAVLFTACTKNELPQLEQNPYRTIIEYTPQTFTMDVAGALTPDGTYDWITVSQSGKTATFTVTRNTKNAIRRAEFTQAGSSEKCIVNQKAHGLDAKVSGTLSVLNIEAGKAVVDFTIATAFPDDYASWGVVFSKTSNMADGTKTEKGKPVFSAGNIVSYDTIEAGKDYFVWGYVTSTEGDVIYSDLVAIITSPILVKAGDDLQTAINNAKEFQEVRVQGGATFTSPDGGFQMGGSNKNKAVSGGWNADFTAQSMDNLTVIDGGKANYGFYCANQGGEPMTGYSKISFFEIINCKGDHGTAIHAVGGPITVSNCYVHDNISEKGAIGTNEGGAQTTLNVINCIVSNNTADAHGPAFGFGEGKSDAEPVKATLVSNLIIDNVSTKKDGYASTFICYNQTELILLNNTIVGNKNWAEYGGPYSGMVLRGDVCSAFVNNIMVGNYTSPCTKEMEAPEYERQEQFINMGGGTGTLAYNIIEGSIKEGTGITDQNNTYVPTTFDVSSILDSKYMPLGQAVGAGTLGDVTYQGKKHEARPLKVKDLLDTYNLDLAGNPRVVGGKVDLGCYQAQ